MLYFVLIPQHLLKLSSSWIVNKLYFNNSRIYLSGHQYPISRRGYHTQLSFIFGIWNRFILIRSNKNKLINDCVSFDTSFVNFLRRVVNIYEHLRTFTSVGGTQYNFATFFMIKKATSFTTGQKDRYNMIG